jgi:hypothetical protein
MRVCGPKHYHYIMSIAYRGALMTLPLSTKAELLLLRKFSSWLLASTTSRPNQWHPAGVSAHIALLPPATSLIDGEWTDQLKEIGAYSITHPLPLVIVILSAVVIAVPVLEGHDTGGITMPQVSLNVPVLLQNSLQLPNIVIQSSIKRHTSYQEPLKNDSGVKRANKAMLYFRDNQVSIPFVYYE